KGFRPWTPSDAPPLRFCRRSERLEVGWLASADQTPGPHRSGQLRAGNRSLELPQEGRPLRRGHVAVPQTLGELEGFFERVSRPEQERTREERAPSEEGVAVDRHAIPLP